jgi:general secretion pathway protein B
MSYILDALRKSEKDRRQDETPILQTLHTPRQVVPTGKSVFSSKSLLWIVVLLTLFIAALVGIVLQGWLPIHLPNQPRTDLSQQQASAPPTENQETDGHLSVQEAAEKLQHENALISAGASSNPPLKTIAEKNPTPSRTIVQEPAPLTVTLGKDDEMSVINRKVSDTPPSSQLPPSVQADIGKMKFAGHVYSEDKGRRMIMINNKILREGDAMDTDFRLNEITRSGVILLYKSTPFRIDLF